MWKYLCPHHYFRNNWRNIFVLPLSQGSTRLNNVQEGFKNEKKRFENDQKFNKVQEASGLFDNVKGERIPKGLIVN